MKSVRCPRCREQAPWSGNPHRPFCSERCRSIELGLWLDGAYSIPAENSGTPVDEYSPEDDFN